MIHQKFSLLLQNYHSYEDTVVLRLLTEALQMLHDWVKGKKKYKTWEETLESDLRAVRIYNLEHLSSDDSK